MTNKEFISRFKEFCIKVAEEEKDSKQTQQPTQISFTESNTPNKNDTTKAKYKILGSKITGVYKNKSKSNNNPMTTIVFQLDNGEKASAYLTWTQWRIKENINNFLKPLGISNVKDTDPINRFVQMDLSFLKDWEVEVEVKIGDFISVDRITKILKRIEDDEVPF